MLFQNVEKNKIEISEYTSFMFIMRMQILNIIYEVKSSICILYKYIHAYIFLLSIKECRYCGTLRYMAYKNHNNDIDGNNSHKCMYNVYMLILV